MSKQTAFNVLARVSRANAFISQVFADTICGVGLGAVGSWVDPGQAIIVGAGYPAFDKFRLDYRSDPIGGNNYQLTAEDCLAWYKEYFAKLASDLGASIDGDESIGGVTARMRQRVDETAANGTGAIDRFRTWVDTNTASYPGDALNDPFAEVFEWVSLNGSIPA